MRIPIPSPAPEYIQTTVTTSAVGTRGFTYHQGTRSTHSTMGYTAPPDVSQMPTQPSPRPQHQTHCRSCPPCLAQSDAMFVAQPSDQPPRPISIPIPYSQTSHTAPPATTQRWSGPPPLDFSKSPYRCIPLPEMTHGPVILNPKLAYSRWQSTQNKQTGSQGQPVDIHHCHHICAPATNPSLGSLTMVLPGGRGITVHASLTNHSFVTVGDVLDALDTMLLGKPSRKLSLPLGELCACSSGSTALHSLRSLYEWAGLTRNDEGFDVWDLRIG